MVRQKIQLIIRDSGLESRRRAEEVIREGRVTVNGKTVLDPAFLADPQKDHIKVDGKLLRPEPSSELYYLFNKPRHVVSTMRDPQERPCVGDLVKALKKRLFTVGRLDFDAEGLMLLTNDGALAQKLTHPSNRIPRTYLVKVKGSPDTQSLARIRRGMPIGEGDRVGDVSWTVIKRQKTTTWIRVVLFEGKKNELKRIFLLIGHPVRKIRRIGFGPLTLGALPTGTWRPLTNREREKLAALLSDSQQGSRKKS